MRIQSWGRYFQSVEPVAHHWVCPHCGRDQGGIAWWGNPDDVVGFDATTETRKAEDDFPDFPEFQGILSRCYKVIRECPQCFGLYWHHFYVSGFSEEELEAELEEYAKSCSKWPKNLL